MAAPPHLPVQGPLYVILDPSQARGRDLPGLLEAVIAGGCRMVQLRDKTRSPAALWPEARRLRDRAGEARVTFIVNDRVDLALALGADGVHLGQEDLPGALARRLLRPGMLLGISTHDAEQARAAVRDGADYVAVGSVFPTGSKRGFQLVGLELVRRVRPDIPVALVGIGGITADNAASVLAAGADCVAVISAVCAAPDPEAATRLLLRRLGVAGPPRRPGASGAVPGGPRPGEPGDPGWLR